MIVIILLPVIRLKTRIVRSFIITPTKFPLGLINIAVGIEFCCNVCKNSDYILHLYLVDVGKSYVYGSHTYKKAR